MQTDPERPKRAWAQGLCPSQDGLTAPASGETTLHGGTNIVEGELASSPHIDADSAVGGGQAQASNGRRPLPRTGAGDDEEVGSKGVVEGGQRLRSEGATVEGVVPDYRLNGFVYVCPLVSARSTFTAKAWLQDEDD